MYECPVKFNFGDIQMQIVKQQENEVYMAVQKCGVDVDKEELKRALKYDREQYEKGYEDAVRQVKEDIIKELMTQREWYLNLYAEFMDGEDYRSSLLLEKVIDIVREC
jgi:Zn-finger nucleic acid-binding protein